MLPKASTLDMLPDEDMCLGSGMATLSWIGIISHDFPLAVHTLAFFFLMRVCVWVICVAFGHQASKQHHAAFSGGHLLDLPW